MSQGDRDGLTGLDAAPSARVSEAGDSRGADGGLVARLVKPGALAALGQWQVGRLTVHLPDGSVHAGGAAEPSPTRRSGSPGALLSPVRPARRPRRRRVLHGRRLADRRPRGASSSSALLNQQVVPLDSWLTKLGEPARRPSGTGCAATPAPGSRRNIAHALRSQQRVLRAVPRPDDDLFERRCSTGPASRSPTPRRASSRRFGDGWRSAPADHVLEIGCGWGGLRDASPPRTYGCRVTGITISRGAVRARHASASRAAGLADRVDIRLCDYRDARRTLRQDRLDRDARGGRRGALADVLRDVRRGARAGRARRPPGDLDARPSVRGATRGAATGFRSTSSRAACCRRSASCAAR